MGTFQRGRSFDSLDDLDYWFSFGSGWVYLRDKRVPIGFTKRMQLQTVIDSIDQNLLFEANEVK